MLVKSRIFVLKAPCKNVWGAELRRLPVSVPGRKQTRAFMWLDNRTSWRGRLSIWVQAQWSCPPTPPPPAAPPARAWTKRLLLSRVKLEAIWKSSHRFSFHANASNTKEGNALIGGEMGHVKLCVCLCECVLVFVCVCVCICVCSGVYLGFVVVGFFSFFYFFKPFILTSPIILQPTSLQTFTVKQLQEAQRSGSQTRSQLSSQVECYVLSGSLDQRSSVSNHQTLGWTACFSFTFKFPFYDVILRESPLS